MDASLYAKSRVNKVVPPDIPERVAPMIITWRETLSYARRIGVQSGMRVLIAGSGANALSFTEHCAYAGAEVCALGPPAREALFRRGGARAYIDYHAEERGARLRDALPARDRLLHRRRRLSPKRQPCPAAPERRRGGGRLRLARAARLRRQPLPRRPFLPRLLRRL